MLQAKKNPVAGRYASSVKYDLLAALGVAGFAKTALSKDLAHRLSVLLVARYDWVRDALSIGHAQLAQMWSCDIRRVKRVISDLKRHGLLSVKQAGVKGRVTVYSIAIQKLAEITRPCWSLIGSDYAERLGRIFPEEGALSCDSPEPHADHGIANPVSADEVDPSSSVPRPDPSWSTDPIKASLAGEMSPMTFQRWILPLRFQLERQRLVVHAPSLFVSDYVDRVYRDAIFRHARRVNPAIVRLTLR